MAEVLDAELTILRNSYALLQGMEKNPTAKAHLERGVKVLHPDVRTEEDIAEAITKPISEKFEAEMATMRAQLAAYETEKAANADKALEANLEGSFAELKKRGFTEDGIGKVKQLMIDRRIPNPEDAAALFEAQNPKPAAEQPGWVPDSWNLEEKATDMDVAGLFKDEDKWADTAAANVLNEIRLGKAA